MRQATILGDKLKRTGELKSIPQRKIAETFAINIATHSRIAMGETRSGRVHLHILTNVFWGRGAAILKQWIAKRVASCIEVETLWLQKSLQ